MKFTTGPFHQGDGRTERTVELTHCVVSLWGWSRCHYRLTWTHSLVRLSPLLFSLQTTLVYPLHRWKSLSVSETERSTLLNGVLVLCPEGLPDDKLHAPGMTTFRSFQWRGPKHDGRKSHVGRLYKLVQETMSYFELLLRHVSEMSWD